MSAKKAIKIMLYGTEEKKKENLSFHCTYNNVLKILVGQL